MEEEERKELGKGERIYILYVRSSPDFLPPCSRKKKEKAKLRKIIISYNPY
jgi:hypothetical protein